MPASYLKASFAKEYGQHYRLNLRALSRCCTDTTILFFINFSLTDYSVYAFCVYNVAKLKHLFEKGVFHASVPRPYYRFSVLT